MMRRLLAIVGAVLILAGVAWAVETELDTAPDTALETSLDTGPSASGSSVFPGTYNTSTYQ